MAKHTVTKPVASKPVAPTAPAKPQAPKAPTAPTVVAKPVPSAPAPKGGKPVAPGKAPTVQPVPAPSNGQAGAGSAILALLEKQAAELAEMKAEIHKLNKRSKSVEAKSKASRVLSVEEILNYEAKDDDWRKPYQGFSLNVHRFQTKKGDSTITVMADQGTVPALLAVPRDFDIGGQGSVARTEDLIAVWWSPREDGTYDQAPAYVTKEELGLIWAD